MTKKKIVLITAITVVLATIYLIFFFDPYTKVDKNNDAFRSVVLLIDKKEVTLNELTPFDWDVMYTFSPYTPVEKMQEIMGVKSNRDISETVNEGMNQFFFVNGDKIVSSIYGYSENIGFYFDFWPENDSWGDFEYLSFKSSEAVRFSVESNDGKKTLTLINN